MFSQTVQQIGHRLLGNVEATMTRRREDPSTRRWLKLPHRPKDDYPLHWPAQAVSHNPATGRMLLPMGRGRKSLIIPGVVLGPGEAAGAVSLSKRRGGYEISVCVRVAEAGAMPRKTAFLSEPYTFVPAVTLVMYDAPLHNELSVMLSVMVLFCCGRLLVAAVAPAA